MWGSRREKGSGGEDGEYSTLFLEGHETHGRERGIRAEHFSPTWFFRHTWVEGSMAGFVGLFQNLLFGCL